MLYVQMARPNFCNYEGHATDLQRHPKLRCRQVSVRLHVFAGLFCP